MIELRVDGAAKIDRSRFIVQLPLDQARIFKVLAIGSRWPNDGGLVELETNSGPTFNSKVGLLSLSLTGQNPSVIQSVRNTSGSDVVMIFGTNAAEVDTLETSRRESNGSPSKTGNSAYPMSKNPRVQSLIDAVFPLVADICNGPFHRTPNAIYVPANGNFMTFKLQEARRQDIVINLYGNPEEFLDIRARGSGFLQANFKAGRNSYSTFKTKDPVDGPVAADLIRRAYELKVSRRGHP